MKVEVELFRYLHIAQLNLLWECDEKQSLLTTFTAARRASNFVSES